MDNFKNIIEEYSKVCKLDPLLVESIISTESSYNPSAIRFEPKWRYQFKVAEFAKLNLITYDTEKTLQMFSYGLGQIMGTVARELGYSGPLQNLCDPELGVKYCVLKLAQIRDRYQDKDHSWWVSAYNQGMPVIVNNRFQNNMYVDKVLSKFEELNKNGKYS